MSRPSLFAVARASILVLVIVGTIALSSPPAYAQSPTPTSTFIDYSPSTFNTSNAGAVVEGLGSGSCSYSLSSIESMTVTYLNDDHPVLTELSPQSYCASLSSYESMVSSIESYVESHASNAGQFWGGIMLDEETGFGFSVSQLITLNQYTQGVMNTTPGSSFWFAQVFSGQGDWSQTDYDNILVNGYPAPQPATSYMVSLINGAHTLNLVSWSATYPYPYNSESYDDGAIAGPPFNHDFYNSCCSQYWDNMFQPV